MGQCASAADLADSLSLLGRHPCCAEQCDLSGILASSASSLACKEFRLGRVDRLWHRAGHRRSSRATTTGERSEPPSAARLPVRHGPPGCPVVVVWW